MFKYFQNQKWKAKRQKCRQQRDMARSLEELKECTFKPSVNPEIYIESKSNQGSFLKRQDDWLRKKNKRLQELGRQNEKKQKQECIFRPKLSKNTYNLLQNPKKSTLYTHKQAIKLNQEPLSKKVSCLTFRSNISRQGCSYKQMYLRKMQLKKQQEYIQKVYGFNLLTERKKYDGFQEEQEFHEDRAGLNNQQEHNNTTECQYGLVKGDSHILEHQLYIQKIQKSQQQLQKDVIFCSQNNQNNLQQSNQKDQNEEQESLDRQTQKIRIEEQQKDVELDWQNHQNQVTIVPTLPLNQSKNQEQNLINPQQIQNKQLQCTKPLERANLHEQSEKTIKDHPQNFNEHVHSQEECI